MPEVSAHGPSTNTFLEELHLLVNTPPDAGNIYTRIKKDIFHAFHMIITPVNHGLRATFYRALCDHILWWDPDIRASVDEACKHVFNLNFDQMLACSPRFIMECTPRYVPPPSVLVPAISHVFDTFGNSLDAKTGTPLFNKTTWQKANAVLKLAREGYLSDNMDIVLYEKAGVDKLGLQKYKCLRGTNNIEGGPRGDIYRKFGALNGMFFTITVFRVTLHRSLTLTLSTAGPWLTVNCLTDHHTWYNLQVSIFIPHESESCTTLSHAGSTYHYVINTVICKTPAWC